MSTNTLNSQTVYVNEHAQHVLDSLSSLAGSTRVSLSTQFEANEFPHEGILNFEDGTQYVLCSSCLHLENKIFLSELEEALGNQGGQCWQTSFGYENPGFDCKTNKFSVDELRDALLVLTTLVIAEPEPVEKITDVEVHQNLRNHFWNLLVKAGGKINQIDTELMILADYDDDNSCIDDESPYLSDLVFTNYYIVDADGVFITKCEEEHVLGISMICELSDGPYGRSTLEDLVGKDFKDFVIVPRMKENKSGTIQNAV